MASKKTAKKKSPNRTAPTKVAVTFSQPQAQLPSSPLYTENEAAKYLRISRTTLIRLRQDGGVNYTRVGNRVFYTREQLDGYIASCNTDSTGEANAVSARAR